LDNSSIPEKTAGKIFSIKYNSALSFLPYYNIYDYLNKLIKISHYFEMS
jgi:hypothetical protein